MKTKLTIALLLFVFTAYTQQIENVHARLTAEQTVAITYNLTYTDATKNFTVSLFVTTNNGQTFTPITKNITGDVGGKIKLGNNKTITWQPFINNPNYKVENAQFKVKASLVEIGRVFVKGGTFQMGANVSGDEKPIHTVKVNDFYIGKYEVTQKQWKDVMGTSNNPSYFKGDNLPVESVSWNDVQTFIEKLNQITKQNYRLPTETEWEYAARGGSAGTPSTYAGSNLIGNVVWYKDNSNGKTQPVGTKQANELGIYDMSGNVWEWCSDWYSSSYYSSSLQNNPQGASSGSYRVRRGGSWDFSASGCRVANRNSWIPEISNNNLGFRLVLSL